MGRFFKFLLIVILLLILSIGAGIGTSYYIVRHPDLAKKLHIARLMGDTAEEEELIFNNAGLGPVDQAETEVVPATLPFIESHTETLTAAETVGDVETESAVEVVVESSTEYIEETSTEITEVEVTEEEIDTTEQEDDIYIYFTEEMLDDVPNESEDVSEEESVIFIEFTEEETVESTEVEETEGYVEGVDYFERDYMLVEYDGYEIDNNVVIIYFMLLNRNENKGTALGYYYNFQVYQGSKELNIAESYINNEILNKGRELNPGTRARVGFAYELSNNYQPLHVKVEPWAMIGSDLDVILERQVNIK